MANRSSVSRMGVIAFALAISAGMHVALITFLTPTINADRKTLEKSFEVSLVQISLSGDAPLKSQQAPDVPVKARVDKKVEAAAPKSAVRIPAQNKSNFANEIVAPSAPRSTDQDTAAAGAIKTPGTPASTGPTLPASATLIFVKATDGAPASDGQNALTISWKLEGDRYSAIIENPSNSEIFTSTGLLKSEGLKPDSFTIRTEQVQRDVKVDWEQRVFQQGRPENASETVPTGLQDQASILFELALMLQNPSYQPKGSGNFIPIATGKNMENFSATNAGEDTVKTPLGEIETFSVKRNLTFDINAKEWQAWFSPANQWLPVRLQYTDQKNETVNWVIQSIQ
jgi:hypothetical protein